MNVGKGCRAVFGDSWCASRVKEVIKGKQKKNHFVCHFLGKRMEHGHDFCCFLDSGLSWALLFMPMQERARKRV